MNFGAKKVGAEAFNDASGCAVPALSPGRDRGWNIAHPLRVLQPCGVPGAGGRRELLVLKGHQKATGDTGSEGEGLGNAAQPQTCWKRSACPRWR